MHQWVFMPAASCAPPCFGWGYADHVARVRFDVVLASTMVNHEILFWVIEDRVEGGRNGQNHQAIQTPRWPSVE